jgi:hypothetical protein
MNTELFRDIERVAANRGLATRVVFAEWMAIQRALQDGRSGLTQADLDRELAILRPGSVP